MLMMKLAAEVKKGTRGLDASLVRHVSIDAQTAAEFLLVFSSVPFELQHLKRVANPTQVSTYLGNRRVLKTHIMYMFRTFKDWVQFVGIATCCAVRHDPDTSKSVLVIPFAPLKTGSSFESSHPVWSLLKISGRNPLHLTRAIQLVLPLCVRHNRTQTASQLSTVIFPDRHDDHAVLFTSAALLKLPMSSV
jgi:hypothetical protein